MADAGAGLIIPEAELTPEHLAVLLRELAAVACPVAATGRQSASALSVPDSLNRITQICLEQAGAVA